MNLFKKNNLTFGWLSFAISAVVYLMTMEPTASLWDCSEFIATSYKLEVGHPPGAPLFMMISRFFTLFAPDQEYVAVMVNTMSSLASAFTILFLFWTITHMACRFYKKSKEELSLSEIWTVMGAGLIGSLVYAFTDTFWFSAIEGEVYALSSLFTAVVFWAMLKWEEVADQPYATRWLVLIAYLMGLSIGVHLLNLLAFPAMVFIYYFRKYPVITKKGIAAATGISVAIVFFVLYILVPGTIKMGAWTDLLFVNGFGLPVNSGLAFFVIALFALLGWAVWFTYQRGRVLLNTFFLMVAVVLLGYSSYASVVIRAEANPPMNSNNPSNAYGLLGLLGRDQYGEDPLLTGPYYSSVPIAIKEKKTYYEGEDEKYHQKYQFTGYEYAPGFTFFFPRMHSSKESHIEAYKDWVDIKGRQIPFYNESVTVPTFGENLQFFFKYQVIFMYWRYFMWNFVGRQSDVPSRGEITDGNWLSGVHAIDELYLGPQKNIPDEMAQNRGRNKYYFLPFLLGIVGLLYQLNRDGRGFTVLMWLFFMTGLAIILYLNQGPLEPRERDYAYAGSFYAFAIWIGFGVVFLYDKFLKFIKNPALAAVVAFVVSASVPAILAAQNWDDHDRSHRYVAKDFGYNYLETTLPNSILMNFGDNDTFPCWYNQEVEDVRLDVRIMNLSYLGAEWYIDQMKIRANDSDPVPFSIPQDKYTGMNESIIVEEKTDRALPIKEVIDWIVSDNPRTKMTIGNRGRINSFIPTRTIILPVNKENAVRSGIVKPEDAHLMEDTIVIHLAQSQYLRSEMMLLDLLANFNWERPLYFTAPHTILGSMGLMDYLQFDGFAYRLVPIRTPYSFYYETGRIDTDYMYDKLMNRFRYGNVKDPRVYCDPTVQSVFGQSQARNGFARLAIALAEKGEYAKAEEVLERGLEEIPFSQIRPTYYGAYVPYVEAYFAVGQNEKAVEMLEMAAEHYKQYIDYYLGFPERLKGKVFSALRENVSYLHGIYGLARHYEQTEFMQELEKYFVEKKLI